MRSGWKFLPISPATLLFAPRPQRVCALFAVLGAYYTRFLRITRDGDQTGVYARSIAQLQLLHNKETLHLKQEIIRNYRLQAAAGDEVLAAAQATDPSGRQPLHNVCVHKNATAEMVGLLAEAAGGGAAAGLAVDKVGDLAAVTDTNSSILPNRVYN